MLQASLNTKLQLVNFESGKVAKTYSGHKNSKFCSISTFVTTLGPRPCIAAGSEDGSIHIWDVNSRKVRWWWWDSRRCDIQCYEIPHCSNCISAVHCQLSRRQALQTSNTSCCACQGIYLQLSFVRSVITCLQHPHSTPCLSAAALLCASAAGAAAAWQVQR
jgi:WD40 repeat protein